MIYHWQIDKGKRKSIRRETGMKPLKKEREELVMDHVRR